MAKYKNYKVGDKVTYVPNGVDFGSRPKNVPVPATIINDFASADAEGKEVVDLHEFTHPETKEKTTRRVYNLIVLQDTDTATVRKVRVPHKADALDGESYFE